MEGILEADGGVAEGAGIRGKGCGEAGRIEAFGFMGGLVDKTEVIEVFEHLDLGRREVGFAVVLAELETSELKAERQNVARFHANLQSNVSRAR